MKTSGKKKLVIAVLIILLVIVLAGVIVFEHYYSMLNRSEEALDDGSIEQSDENDSALTGKELDEDEISELENYLRENLEAEGGAYDFESKDVFNILLIGTDNRGISDSGYRSDTMMIVSINKDTKKVTLSSALRDIYVAIPGCSPNRLNVAYAIGGPDLLIETLEANFKIPIDRYAKIDFFSFIKVIDIIGGINLDVTAEEIGVMQRYIRELNRIEGVDENTDMLYESDEGPLQLNGKQALAYARNRYTGYGDFSRTERQRKVIMAVKDKSDELDLAKLNELADAVLPEITTNLTRGDVLFLLLNAFDFMDYEMQQYCIPQEGTYNLAMIDGMSVITVDFSANAEKWFNAVYGE